jgi:hypothetical protein
MGSIVLVKNLWLQQSVKRAPSSAWLEVRKISANINNLDNISKIVSHLEEYWEQYLMLLSFFCHHISHPYNVTSLGELAPAENAVNPFQLTYELSSNPYVWHELDPFLPQWGYNNTTSSRANEALATNVIQESFFNSEKNC